MSKVVYVCINDTRQTPEICHVFTKEQDAKDWCLGQYRLRYMANWDVKVKEHGETEEDFIQYLTSGEVWPYGYHDVNYD